MTPRPLPRPIGVGPDGPALAVAHRGDWRGSRENTLPAVAAAVRAGADLVEIDVKTTADGEVVLLHDDSLQRLWGDPREVTDCGWAELAALGADGHAIPTLDATLALTGGTGTALLIDMDAERWAQPAWRVVDCAVTDGLIVRDEVAWCGRTAALQRIRDLDPSARIVLSWDEGDGLAYAGPGTLPPDDQLAALRPEAVNPHWPMITAATLDWAGRRGLPLCCWTVDEEPEMARLLALGVRAMISNDIRTLRRVIDQTAPGRGES